MILLETIYVVDNNWAIQIIIYRRRLYFATFTHIFVLKKIFFPKIEFYFIQRKLREAKYVSFRLSFNHNLRFPFPVDFAPRQRVQAENFAQSRIAKVFIAQCALREICVRNTWARKSTIPLR